MLQLIFAFADNYWMPVWVASEDDSDFEDESASNDESRGLTSERIKKFPTFNADHKTVGDGCAICIDGVEINKLMIRLDCNHFYCCECVSKWFEKNVSCPVCRKEYFN